ncbi:hypothetical protein SCLCIDRAFT_1222413, partial [Scleroderma citrinum Foug A]
MLLASFLILNKTDAIGEYTIYPYVHFFSNVPRREAMLKAVQILDVLPSDLPQGSSFSLVTGEFEVPSTRMKTNHKQVNGMQSSPASSSTPPKTLSTIFVSCTTSLHRILAPGGVWINLGPLLWHFENNENNYPSIEL